MKISPATLALVSLVFGASNSDLSGLEGSITNSRQVQDTLNRQLQRNSAHSNQAMLNAFITGADSQIDNTVATISSALAPLTGGLSQVIGNFLLGPMVQATTNGAEVLLSNLIGGGADLIDAELIGTLTRNYSRLSALAAKNNVDSSKLQSLSEEISKTMSKKISKRSKEDQTDGNLDGFKGAITNMKQTVDTLKAGFSAHDGHIGKDTVNALITGLDGQIDNLAASISQGLNGVTLGISGKVGDFLLGPLFQSITNGAEVLISNVVGGGIDIVTDGSSKLFSGALSQLHAIGEELNVKTDTLDSLNKVQKQVAHLKRPSKKQKSSSQAKRSSDFDMNGVNDAMLDYQQAQDAMNQELRTYDGHASQAILNGFIGETEAQINHAISIVSDGLAPFTGGISQAVGNVLLSPFLQSVTAGAEIFFDNLVGVGANLIPANDLQIFSDALARLYDASSQFGVNERSQINLSKVQQKIVSFKAQK